MVAKPKPWEVIESQKDSQARHLSVDRSMKPQNESFKKVAPLSTRGDVSEIKQKSEKVVFLPIICKVSKIL